METLTMDMLRNTRIRAGLVVLYILGILTPVTWSQELRDSGKRDIEVATANLYIGADFTPVLTLDPSDPNYGSKLVAGVAAIYGRVRQSKFLETRADALARQIVMQGPDLVALQEVTLLLRQSPGDAIFGGTVKATSPDLDYLAILLEALRRQGGHYEVVSEIQDVDVELPLVTGPGAFDDIRLIDRDVILARTDLPPGHLRTFNPQAANFAARLPLSNLVTVLRGWCSIDFQVRGRQFRFINSHLEDQLPAGLPNIQLGQAFELLRGPADTKLPVILAGDFNSDAYGNYSPATYGLLTSVGAFRDLWSVAGGRSLGLTWGHDELLANPAVPFSLRLDIIFFRGEKFDATDAVVVDPIIGTVPPLWFSDHAALFGTIAIH
jgi:endonuclease/exonuclease/phosphatase family metal-dependent hydrolase